MIGSELVQALDELHGAHRVSAHPPRQPVASISIPRVGDRQDVRPRVGVPFVRVERLLDRLGEPIEPLTTGRHLLSRSSEVASVLVRDLRLHPRSEGLHAEGRVGNSFDRQAPAGRTPQHTRRGQTLPELRADPRIRLVEAAAQGLQDFVGTWDARGQRFQVKPQAHKGPLANPGVGVDCEFHAASQRQSLAEQAGHVGPDRRIGVAGEERQGGEHLAVEIRVGVERARQVRHQAPREQIRRRRQLTEKIGADLAPQKAQHLDQRTAGPLVCDTCRQVGP